MKKYFTLGELLIDYRHHSHLSQFDLASALDVDQRTVQRWENDLTLLNTAKEESLVLETLMPYQLIHNLNARVPIPTYYDFNNKKYSLHERTNELPSAAHFREEIELRSHQLRPINYELDRKYLDRFIDKGHEDHHIHNETLLKKAIELLPELNKITTSDAGYYTGHSVTLPITESAFNQLRNRQLTSSELQLEHLANYKQQEKPIFYSYDMCADCNETGYLILASYLRFFKELSKDYILCIFTTRDDNLELNKQMGLHIVWEDTELQKILQTEYPPRFVEGNYSAFLEEPQ